MTDLKGATADAERPVVLLAFANDEQAFLGSIKTEQADVASALLPYETYGCIQLWQEGSLSVASLFRRFGEFRGRVALFHYGGHASGQGLRLDGGEAAATGLAELFRDEAEALKLIFLNGCSTRDQVERLLEFGVKAVIATSAPINDEAAGVFSTEFYASLANGMSIGEAYARACARIRTDKDRVLPSSRGMSWEAKAQTKASDALPWDLHLRPGSEAVLDWKLPELPRRGIVRGLPEAMAVFAANDRLREALLDGLSAANTSFESDVRSMRRERRPPVPKLQQAIVNVFPTPIGEQVRKLFNLGEPKLPRLQQLLRTYDITVQLFCFAVLAQLWDERVRDPELKIADAERRALEAFPCPADERAGVFDYFGLVVSVMRIFEANSVQPFMPDCEKLANALTDDDVEEPVETAYAFMEALRGRIAQPISDDHLVGLCAEAEDHLAVILSDLAFVTRYKPTTIKKIELWRARNGAPRYLYSEVALDGLTSPPEESKYFLHEFSDSGCVLLQEYRFTPDAPIAGTYLNLSPFVIDESSIDETAVSNLYFLTGYDARADAYHYTSVADPRLEIIAAHTPDDYGITDRLRALSDLKQMLDDFKAAMVGR